MYLLQRHAYSSKDKEDDICVVWRWAEGVFGFHIANVIHKLHSIILYRLVLSFFLYDKNEQEQQELKAVDVLHSWSVKEDARGLFSHYFNSPNE
jgi:hypothetical protein